LYAGVLYMQPSWYSFSSWPHSDITSFKSFSNLHLFYSRDVFGIGYLITVEYKTRNWCYCLVYISSYHLVWIDESKYKTSGVSKSLLWSLTFFQYFVTRVLLLVNSTQVSELTRHRNNAVQVLKNHFFTTLL